MKGIFKGKLPTKLTSQRRNAAKMKIKAKKEHLHRFHDDLSDRWTEIGTDWFL